MKRVSIIALALALLLCGCGSAPRRSRSVPQRRRRTKLTLRCPRKSLRMNRKSTTAHRDFLRSLYDECGNFYFSNNAAPDCLDWLAQQPQDSGEVCGLRMAVF